MNPRICTYMYTYTCTRILKQTCTHVSYTLTVSVDNEQTVKLVDRLNIDQKMRLWCWACKRRNTVLITLLMKDKRVDPSINQNAGLFAAMKKGDVEVRMFLFYTATYAYT